MTVVLPLVVVIVALTIGAIVASLDHDEARRVEEAEYRPAGTPLPADLLQHEREQWT